MEPVLEVKGLCKTYPAFYLDHASFAVQPSSVMGFIGRNGAGKTTAIKSILHLAHPDSGEIRYWGQALDCHEAEIKERIGYASSGTAYYQRRKIREIAAVTRRFYARWDQGAYRRYMQKFALDEEKKPFELSEGMKVKLQLALALSHNAELLILDEPTSGLDPVSREELLDIFLGLAEEGVTIFFSTHITSDLDKCADAVTYIRKGKIVSTGDRRVFTGAYRLIRYEGEVTEAQRAAFLGVSRTVEKNTALISQRDAALFPPEWTLAPTLEQIMVHLEKEGEQ